MKEYKIIQNSDKAELEKKLMSYPLSAGKLSTLVCSEFPLLNWLFCWSERRPRQQLAIL